MAYLEINQDKVTTESAKQLQALCPFGAITGQGKSLSITAACRMCRLCVKKGPEGVVRWVEEEAPASVDKKEWRGIAVYAEHDGVSIHPVTLDLLGKARELAEQIGHPVYVLVMGSGMEKQAETLLGYGADRVFLYDHPGLADFNVLSYTNVFEDFIRKIKPSSVLVGATNTGRSLAPRTAARFRTGLTADCTVLQMKEDTDLVQIRPAFGGNIMAQIVTPRHRPQFCTVRYKICSMAGQKEHPTGTLVHMDVKEGFLDNRIQVLGCTPKEKQVDISEADVIVAVGRGVKSQADLELMEQLAQQLGAQMACTRPLVENGWFDPRQQIGLSGRTVKPKLIITAGISGSVQFAAGMRGADCIIAVNRDKKASIFDVAHYGIVGDLYEIIPELIRQLKGELE